MNAQKKKQGLGVRGRIRPLLHPNKNLNCPKGNMSAIEKNFAFSPFETTIVAAMGCQF